MAFYPCGAPLQRLHLDDDEVRTAILALRLFVKVSEAMPFLTQYDRHRIAHAHDLHNRLTLLENLWDEQALIETTVEGTK